MSLRVVLVGSVVALLLSAAIITADGYELYILCLVGLTSMVGIGLNVLLGLTGQISLGHVGFYAIGAYTVGILTVNGSASFWVALPAAGLMAGLAGALLAIPALRVRGPYLAMVTIAFGFVVEQGAAEWRGLTGGWNGLMGIPKPALGGLAMGEVGLAFLILVLTGLALYLYGRLSHSPWGKAMRAIRDSETAGQSIGLNPIIIRTTAFALSAVMAGLAGGIFAPLASFISPESFPFFESILFLLVVMIGGADRVTGPLVGALVVVLLPEFLSGLAEYRLLFVGAMLLLVLRLAPGGVVGVLAKLLLKPAPALTAEAKCDIEGILRVAGHQSGLTARDIGISFGGVRALNGLSFEAESGKITSIIGPNGAGKTTALNLIGGFYTPDQGQINLGAADVSRCSAHAVARAGIARTYQTTQLFENMTVFDNVLIALRQGRLGPRALFAREAAEGHAEIAESLLAFVGYQGSVLQLAGELPHVDKRLVEIARALATRPRVLLLDEPAAGLGHADTEKLIGLLRRVAGQGLAVILVEHDVNLVMTVSDRVVVLDSGAKIADGPPAVVRNDPLVRAAYLGEEKAEGRPRVGQPAATGEVLSVRNLSASYGSAQVLKDIDLDVRNGEVVAVLGANGAGKSTLMRALCGLHRPVTGAVQLDGQGIQDRPAHRIAALGAILVPEGRQVFPELSVLDNIRLGAYARGGGDLGAGVESMLNRFPRLRERVDQRAGLLSGGEQQMLAIARGLIAAPRIIMLDEPSLGLAPHLIGDLYATLADLRDEGATILLVDQMAALALGVADRVFVLGSGAITYGGSAAELSSLPELEQAYLGDF